MLLDIIKSRRSIRSYLDREIPDEDLQYILECGRHAPSGGNEQPWMFGVIDDRELIQEIARNSSGQKWIGSAPAVIALCTKRFSDEDLNVEKYRLGKLREEIYDVDPNVLDILCAQEHQALIAAENMALAAAERGIGSCIVALVDIYRVSKILKVPNSHLVTYILTLGYPAKAPNERQVKTMDEIVFHNIYNK
jgi:Nitroreductase